MSNPVLVKELISYKEHLLSEISEREKNVLRVTELLNSLNPLAPISQVSQSTPIGLVATTITHSDQIGQDTVCVKVVPKDVSVHGDENTNKKNIRNVQYYKKRDLLNNKSLILSYVNKLFKDRPNEDLTAVQLCRYLETEFGISIDGGEGHPSQVLAHFLRGAKVKTKGYCKNVGGAVPVKIYCA